MSGSFIITAFLLLITNGSATSSSSGKDFIARLLSNSETGLKDNSVNPWPAALLRNFLHPHSTSRYHYQIDEARQDEETSYLVGKESSARKKNVESPTFESKLHGRLTLTDFLHAMTNITREERYIDCFFETSKNVFEYIVPRSHYSNPFVKLLRSILVRGKKLESKDLLKSLLATALDTFNSGSSKAEVRVRLQDFTRNIAFDLFKILRKFLLKNNQLSEIYYAIDDLFTAVAKEFNGEAVPFGDVIGIHKAFTRLIIDEGWLKELNDELGINLPDVILRGHSKSEVRQEVYNILDSFFKLIPANWNKLKDYYNIIKSGNQILPLCFFDVFEDLVIPALFSRQLSSKEVDKGNGAAEGRVQKVNWAAAG